MALTPIEIIGPSIQRAGCFFCCALSLMIVYVFGDIWRIERRTGQSLNAIMIGFVAAAVLAVGAIFGRCAIMGCPNKAPAPAKSPTWTCQ